MWSGSPAEKTWSANASFYRNNINTIHLFFEWSVEEIVNLKKIFNLVAVVGIISAGTALAVDGNSSDDKTKLVGMGSFEAGQFMKCEILGGNNQTEKLWYQKTYMHLGFSAVVNDRTNLYFIGEGMVRYAYGLSKDKVDDNRPQYLFYPHHAQITYSFGDIGKPFLKLGAGVFPFKYNPDVRNLGEYLFRTNTYPPTMRSQFDFPVARLTGFQISSTPIDSLNLCAMLTSESQVLPLQDFGPSFLADYTILRSITVGAGVFFSHLWSVNEKYTTPQNSNNAIIDSATGLPKGYYTFRGTKLMGRLNFDPKPFIPWNIFSENDLTLYTEAAVLGLENQQKYYEELWRRIPFMVGFNLPMTNFKVFGIKWQPDLLSVELEWYKWNYRNSYSTYLFAGMLPLPDSPEPSPDYKENILKWSVYMKKSIGRNFSVIGQVAFDHMPYERNVYLQSESYFGDAMHKHGDWAWILKTQFDY